MAKKIAAKASTNGHVKTRAPAGGARFGGKTYRAGQVVPKKYRRFLDEGKFAQDPASNIVGAPPNFERVVIPQAITFQGMTTSWSMTYRNPDNAIRDSVQNARFMRNDCSIMECLEARQRATAMLNWHLETDDAKDEQQKQLIADLTKIIQETPDFTEYRRNLLEAIWYGRYAVQHAFGFERLSGKRRTVVKRWLPINGDKLAFRFDDGSGRYQDGDVGIRVGTQWRVGDVLGGNRVIEFTDSGPAYFLEHWERSRIALHKHIIEDGAYEDPISAGRIHGVGVRDRIYWSWFQKQETMAHLMEVIERTGTGFTIYYYPAGNPQAKADVEDTAARQSRTNVLIMPRNPGDPTMDAYGIERIEPSTAGIEAMKAIVHEFFGHQIKRYILGQTLSTEASATGLGSGVADLHENMFLGIIAYDAVKLEETLTKDLVRPLKAFNFPWARDIPVRLKIDTKEAESESKLAAFKTAWEMGAKIKTADVMDIIGAAMPSEGDEFLINPQIAQQMRLFKQSGDGADDDQLHQLFGPLADLMQGSDAGGMGDDGGGEFPPGDEGDDDGGGGDSPFGGLADEKSSAGPQQYARSPMPDEIRGADDLLRQRLNSVLQSGSPAVIGQIADFLPRRMLVDARIQHSTVRFDPSFPQDMRHTGSEVIIGPSIRSVFNRLRALGAMFLHHVDLMANDFGKVIRYAAIAPTSHNVGETKVVNGVTYRLNDHHRWELVDDSESAEQPGDSRFKQPEEPGADHAVRDQAAKAGLKSVDKRIGGIIRALHESPEYKSGGAITTMAVAPAQAKQAYQILQKQIGQKAAGGHVVDFGEGRIGFASAAGSFVIEPTEGGKFNVHYTNQTDLVGGGETGDQTPSPGDQDTPSNSLDDTISQPDAPADATEKVTEAPVDAEVVNDPVDDPDDDPEQEIEIEPERVDPRQARQKAEKARAALDAAVDAWQADVEAQADPKTLARHRTNVSSLRAIWREHESSASMAEKTAAKRSKAEKEAMAKHGVDKLPKRTAKESRDEEIRRIEKEVEAKRGPTETPLLDQPERAPGEYSPLDADIKNPKQWEPKDKRVSWPSIVQQKAAEWEMPAEHYERIANEIYKEMNDRVAEREAAKAQARRMTGLSQADINRLENQGYDSGSEHDRIKNLDTVARELASHYPSLGWGAGAEEGVADDADHSEDLWNLIREGKQPLLSRTSPEFLKEIDDFLGSHGSSGTTMTPEEQEALAAVPFAKKGIRRAYIRHCQGRSLCLKKYEKEPTEAQKEAGNFKKKHLRIHGMDISIENEKGTRRQPEWEPLWADYGYLRKTEGKDGDHVDVFVGPDPESEIVFVIDQEKVGGEFDEHKCMIGWSNQEKAVDAYARSYGDDWRVGPVIAMTISQFKDWLKYGNQNIRASATPIISEKFKELADEGRSSHENHSKGN